MTPVDQQNSLDIAIIGSGINALTAGALLAKAGRRVTLFERSETIGGCMQTEELVEGVTYDPMATTFVLWVTGGAHPKLAADLARHGVEFMTTDTPTGVLRHDGSHLLYKMDRAANIAAFNAAHPGDGDQLAADLEAFGAEAGLIFGLMGGNPWSFKTAKLLAGETWRRKPRGLVTAMGGAMTSMRAWVESSFTSELSRGLWAPWCLHAGLGPEATFSGKMGQVIGFALEMAGAPVAKGGSATVARALAAIIAEHGGSVRTNAEVTGITVTKGRAEGLQLASGEVFSAKGILASVTPHKLYGDLLGDPSRRDDLRKFRYGTGNFQLHYALKGSVGWANPALEKVQLLHITDGLDAVSRAGNEAQRGMLPVEPTICLGQPLAADPSRAPDGISVLWLQMPETPRHVKGDAAGLIETPANGEWTEALREAYADRIEAILARHIPDLAARTLRRRALSPADLQAANVNLVGGDPYGGSCTLDQFFTFRPFADTIRHETGVKGLWHIGASTHPGPGLSGGSGLLAAGEVLG